MLKEEYGMEERAVFCRIYAGEWALLWKIAPASMR